MFQSRNRTRYTEINELSFLSANGSIIKKDSFVLNSTFEELLYFLSKDHLAFRLYNYLTPLDTLNFLNACKPTLIKKSKSLAQRVFRRAAEPLLLDRIVSADNTPNVLSPGARFMDSIQRVRLLSFWALFISFEAFKPEEDFKYNRGRKSSEELNIEDDIGRTIPHKMVSGTSRHILKSVLVALSNSIPKLGYIQGLNAIVGALTLGVMDLPELNAEHNLELVQQTVYCGVKHFLVGRNFLLFYTDGFLRYRSLCLQLSLMMAAILPELSSHFVACINQKRVSFELGPLTMKWFFTLFSEFLPPWMVALND